MKEEHHFYTKSGKKLKDLRELAMHLKELPKEDHDHHITATKNDFATWVHHIFGDEKIASKMHRTNNPERMSRLVESIYAPRSEIKIQENQMIRRTVRERLTALQSKDLDFLVPSDDDKPKAPKPRKTKKGTKDLGIGSKKPRIPKSIFPELPQPGAFPSAPRPSLHLTCDHSAHLNCMRCGVVEFGIGLAVGLTLAFMYARAFF